MPINNTSPMQDPNEISKFIGTPAVLQFKDTDGNVVMQGDDIQSAKMTFDQSGHPQVDFTLSPAGSTKFANATARLVGQPISIVLDGTVISAPNVQSVIAGGSGQITSPTFTQQSASELAMQIESGALPLDLNEIESQSESADSGREFAANEHNGWHLRDDDPFCIYDIHVQDTGHNRLYSAHSVS